MSEPVNNVMWIDAESLNGNDYNPNVVFNQELKLLEHSILKNGWIHPIVVDQNKTIIDGFHRWRLSIESKKIKEKYRGLIPCVVLELERAERIFLTIRINRAKGSHVAFKMNKIVKELIDELGISKNDIANEIGCNLDEVELLYQDNVFKAKKINKYKYSKAWYPIENKESVE